MTTPTKRKRLPKPITIVETKTVPVSSVRTYHRNPRVGNLEAIAASLEESGQFKPIVVNIGSKIKDRESAKNEILGGNHTYMAAKSLGWKEIVVSFVDVTETQAKKIVLADNKTADLGSYDEKIIAELFESLPDIAGTGYSSEEVEDILASIQVETPDIDTQSLIDGVNMSNEDDDGNGDGREPASARERYIRDREESDDDAEERSTRLPNRDDVVDDPDIVEDAPVDKMAELQVVLEMKEDNIWKNPDNFYGIPRIPESSILERFPDDVVTWIGHEATQDKPGRHFLYNYSLGGTKGIPWDRTILAFNTYDTKFISWWDTPSYNLARLMVKGLRMAVVPDFSYYYTETRIHHLWGVYRANWLGRFFAEAGLKVIPRVQWDYRDPEFMETALQGVPVNTPTLECSIQNINEEPDRKKAAKQLRELLEHIKPGQFMAYGGKPAQRMVEASGWKGEVIHVLSYSNARREAGVFDRKEGAAKLSAKQKQALREKYGATDSKTREERIEEEYEEEY